MVFPEVGPLPQRTGVGFTLFWEAWGDVPGHLRAPLTDRKASAQGKKWESQLWSLSSLTDLTRLFEGLISVLIKTNLEIQGA